MTDKRTFVFAHQTARKLAAELCMTAPEGYFCTIQEPSRTLEQNAYQWPYLEGFAKQRQWPVNGVMVNMSKEEWKDVLTSAFEEDTDVRLAQGMSGGVVMLGRRTSGYGKKKFAEWMEFLIAAAALKEVEPVFKDGWRKWTTSPHGE